MDTTTRAAAALLLAAGLAGCATTGQSGPATTALGCEPISWTAPVPETVRPEEWQPKPHARAYVHVRFVAEPSGIYAIIVPVVDLVAETPVVVGPMENLERPFPEDEDKATAELRGVPHWSAFYRKLYATYGHSRPMALVCPGRDCRLTPEGPPPPLYGMTAAYGTAGTGALTPPELERAYAALAQGATQGTATDALRPGASRTAQQDAERTSLVSDTVARATCAARILAGKR